MREKMKTGGPGEAPGLNDPGLARPLAINHTCEEVAVPRQVIECGCRDDHATQRVAGSPQNGSEQS